MERYDAMERAPEHLCCRLDVTVLGTKALSIDTPLHRPRQERVGVLLRIPTFDDPHIIEPLWRRLHEHEPIVVRVCHSKVGVRYPDLPESFDRIGNRGNCHELSSQSQKVALRQLPD